MSKQLSLIAILVLTSIASAVPPPTALYDVSVNNNPYQGQDVIPGDFVEITWRVDEANEFTFGPAYQGVYGTISNVTNAIVQPHYPGLIFTDWTGAPDGNGGFEFFGNSVAFPLPAAGTEIVTIQFPIPILPVNTPIVFDVASGNLGQLGFASTGPGDNAPYAEFNVIPEPMTMSLLGLGGIAIIRRKNYCKV